MKPVPHVILSAAIAGGAFAATASPSVALATFLTGFIVDADHLDRLKGVKPRIDLVIHPIRTARALFKAAYYDRPSKVHLPLHSYELLVPLWAIAASLSALPLATWISVAFVTHLLADQIAYRPHPLFYLLTFRALRGFKAEGIIGHIGATSTLAALLIVCGIYLTLHIVVMIQYTPVPDQPEALGWFNVIQRLTPTLLLGLLIPGIQHVLNRMANLRVWTIVGSTVVAACVVMYFSNITGRWFAWPTLGLLVLLMITIANSQSRLGNVSAWLLGGMVALLAIGSWEILYQTGLLIYYDFFGCGITNYYVTIVLQLTWIIPALIVSLVLHQRGLHFKISRTTLVCAGIAVIATAIWFATGMDIPLLFWKGHFIEVNEAARPLMISISRGSQGFWLLTVASCFLPGGHSH